MFRSSQESVHLSFQLFQILAASKPEFQEAYYEKYVAENSSPGIEVVQVEVKERPVNSTSAIRYRLDEKAMPYFVINENTGMITTKGEPLDWNVTPVITFPVYAYEDRNPNITAVTFVRVIVSKTIDLLICQKHVW